jgi:hypothetical protein
VVVVVGCWLVLGKARQYLNFIKKFGSSESHSLAPHNKTLT